MPKTDLSDESFTDGSIALLDLLTAAKLSPSRSEAKRLVMQGGVLVDDVKAESFSMTIPKERFANGVVVKKGKKIFHRFIIK